MGPGKMGARQPGEKWNRAKCCAGAVAGGRETRLRTWLTRGQLRLFSSRNDTRECILGYLKIDRQFNANRTKSHTSTSIWVCHRKGGICVVDVCCPSLLISHLPSQVLSHQDPFLTGHPPALRHGTANA